MQIMGIEPTRPAHDALGDAYHTALICSRLRLAEGIDAYEKAAEGARRTAFTGAELPGCVARHVSHGYAIKLRRLRQWHGRKASAPLCRRGMTCGKWYPQPGKALYGKVACEQDGEFLVARAPQRRTRTAAHSRQRLVYSPDAEAAGAATAA